MIAASAARALALAVVVAAEFSTACQNMLALGQPAQTQPADRLVVARPP
jgi:hypothetical protein